MSDVSNVCEFCSKEFSSKISLLRHQKTTKTCLKVQGKEENESVTECPNCNKRLSIEYFKQHKVKCDITVEEQKKNKEKEQKSELYNELKSKYDSLENQNKELENEVKKLREITTRYESELKDYERVKNRYEDSKEVIEKLTYEIGIFREQNEKLQNLHSTLILKLIEK